MYVPQHFSLTDDERVEALRAIGFAHLVTPTADGLVATPLPLVYDEPSHALLGHVARNNPHWHAAAIGESLAIVPGADAYISPSWYPSKAEHGRVVPTWNYDVLHVHGRLIAHDDVDWLRAFVTRLTERYEHGRRDPWQVTDAPTRFIDGQLRAIVGVELQITRVEGKAKLGQNRSDADRHGAIEALEHSEQASDRAVARRMTIVQRTRSASPG